MSSLVRPPPCLRNRRSEPDEGALVVAAFEQAVGVQQQPITGIDVVALNRRGRSQSQSQYQWRGVVACSSSRAPFGVTSSGGG